MSYCSIFIAKILRTNLTVYLWCLPLPECLFLNWREFGCGNYRAWKHNITLQCILGNMPYWWPPDQICCTKMSSSTLTEGVHTFCLLCILYIIYYVGQIDAALWMGDAQWRRKNPVRWLDAFTLWPNSLYCPKCQWTKKLLLSFSRDIFCYYKFTLVRMYSYCLLPWFVLTLFLEDGLSL